MFLFYMSSLYPLLNKNGKKKRDLKLRSWGRESHQLHLFPRLGMDLLRLGLERGETARDALKVLGTPGENQLRER